MEGGETVLSEEVRMVPVWAVSFVCVLALGVLSSTVPLFGTLVGGVLLTRFLCSGSDTVAPHQMALELFVPFVGGAAAGTYFMLSLLVSRDIATSGSLWVSWLIAVSTGIWLTYLWYTLARRPVVRTS